MANTPYTALFDGPELTRFDPAYRNVRSDDYYKGDRELLSSEWREFEPLADRQFLKEFRHDFASRAWEMRVGCLLQRHGKAPGSADSGPDFWTGLEGSGRVWIECVAPKPGTGPDEVPVPPIRETFLVDEKPFLLRFSSVIADKHRKWTESYVPKSLVADEDAFVIAVNAAKIHMARNFDLPPPHLPWIARMLYGLGEDYVQFIPSGGEVYGHHVRFDIRKASGAVITTAMFQKPEYAAVSAVLFSRQNTANRPERFDKPPDLDFILVHNPHARVSVPRGWLPVGREYFVDDGWIQHEDWRPAK